MTTTLTEKILAIEEHLRRADLPHAFGGALALAFHIAEPRATRDIDINLFVPATAATDAFDALPAGIDHDDDDIRQVVERGQVRVHWGDNPVDLFFSNHRFHDEAELRVVEVPFAGTTIPILGATELTVFKAFFDRTKDWADIEEMLAVSTVDVHRALGWLVDLLGGTDRRVARFRTLAGTRRSAAEPRFDPP